ncbi:hypothetical protein [Fictibacillus sp. NRS-1165]|uniref:hypothetical protein n=1 Tax=Fictibacillus sp. NRS-1165 TaxID=3144463 RepID=UPI003D21A1D8
MTVFVKPVPGKKFKEVHYKGEFLTYLYFDQSGYVVDLVDGQGYGGQSDPFPTAAQAIGKALSYYKGFKKA